MTKENTEVESYALRILDAFLEQQIPIERAYGAVQSLLIHICLEMKMTPLEFHSAQEWADLYFYKAWNEEQEKIKKLLDLDGT